MRWSGSAHRGWRYALLYYKEIKMREHQSLIGKRFGKLLSFGSFTRFEDAVAARKAAEIEYYGAFLEELSRDGELKEVL